MHARGDQLTVSPTNGCPTHTQRVSSVGGGGSDMSESAALRETRATYLPAAGEVPEWEKEEAALAFLDEEEVGAWVGGGEGWIDR